MMSGRFPKAEPEWLERARRGDMHAHARLYETFGPMVYTLACRMLASRSQAEDVLQETFVDVIRKLRDGEPIDALLRERLVANPDNVREIERLARVAEDLRRLPLIEPPRGAWERIAAEAKVTRPRAHVRPALLAAAAVVLALAGILLAAPWRTSDVPETAGVRAEDALPTPPLEPEEPVLEADYARLVAESARLELTLAELRHSPQLMNAGTAGTIADLEDYIVLVDEQLSYAEARGTDLRYRHALWRERVDVLSALLHVRYAQAWTRTY